jgi:hypothetical protein
MDLLQYARFAAWIGFWTGFAYWLASSRPGAPRFMVWFAWLCPFFALAILLRPKRTTHS